VGKPIDWQRDYALCATPAKYGDGGKRTFIICSNGTVFCKDLGRSGFVEDYPANPTAKGWTIGR